MDFYRACQTEGETFTSFYTILKELNAACNFQSPLEAVCHDCRTTIEACEHCNTRVKQVHSETMRDRILVGILVGIRCDETRHKLLAKAEITLEEAIAIIMSCRGSCSADAVRYGTNMPGVTAQSCEEIPAQEGEICRQSGTENTMESAGETNSHPVKVQESAGCHIATSDRDQMPG
eukprot:scpid92264/ scgid30179/ 